MSVLRRAKTNATSVSASATSMTAIHRSDRPAALPMK